MMFGTLEVGRRLSFFFIASPVTYWHWFSLSRHKGKFFFVKID